MSKVSAGGRRTLGKGRGSGRALFEEVGTSQRAPAAAPGAAERIRLQNRLWVSRWLWLLTMLVAAMTLIGGMTRLTDISLWTLGWHPVLDVIPPRTEADWLRAFSRHQEATQGPVALTLEAFRPVFWWAWSHQQLGRVIGLVWTLGLLVFAIRRMMPPGFWPAVLFPGLLVGVQAALGWWTLQSGILDGWDSPRVAPYALAIHLGLSFLALGLLLWPAWRLARPEVQLLQARRRRSGAVMTGAGILVALCFIAILLGALVSGNEAGRSHADWPLMTGEILPPAAFELSPVWRNVFENDALTQFNHRIGAYLLGLWSIVWVFMARRQRLPRLTQWSLWALIAVWLQGAGGVVTLMDGVRWEWAGLHQAGAILTLGLVLRARFEAAYPREVSIRG